MRSMLFVPGDSERKLEKSLQSGADALIVDLEDSVAPANKEAARKVAAGFFSARTRDTGPALYVRVNDFTTGLTDDDLAAVVAARPDGIMLPKSTSGHDVTRLSVKLRVHEAEAGLDDGTIRIKGSSVGRFESNGTVRKRGSSVGSIDNDGTIRKGGSSVGRIESNGTLRRRGSSIGRIESGGTIRKRGSSWGSASNCCGSFGSKKTIAAVLVFFADDYFDN